MPDPEKSTRYDAEAKGRTDEILKWLNSGKLPENAKVILVMGPTGAGKTSLVKLVTNSDLKVERTLQNGTIYAHCTITEIDSQLFIFVDTPGFGYPDITAHQVKESIYTILGRFTRELGGIHGILYLQSILSDRTSTGMRESISFLNELANENLRRHVTFVTTKWDSVSPKGMKKSKRLVEGLKASEWKWWKVGESKGARYFKHAVGDEDSSQDKAIGKERLLKNAMSYYATAELKCLAMPFSQRKFGDQVATVVSAGAAAATPLLGVGLVVGVIGTMALAVASGVPVVLTFSVAF